MPPKCYGPMPVKTTGRHPMVFMEFLLKDGGVSVYICPVCGKFATVHDPV